MAALEQAQIDYLKNVLGLDRVLVPKASLRSAVVEKTVEVRGAVGPARLFALVPLPAAEFPLRGETEALLEKMLLAMKLQKTEVLIATWIAGEDFAIEEEVAQLARTAGGRPILVFGGQAAAERLIEARKLGEWGAWAGARVLATFSPRELLDSPEHKRLAWVHLQIVMKHL